MTEIIAAIVGGLLTLLGAVVIWVLKEKAQRRRVRSEKLQDLVKAIHRAHLQVLRLNGAYASKADEFEMENTVNEIAASVSLFFPEFGGYADRLRLFYLDSITGLPHAPMAGELRALEQDLIAVWEGYTEVLTLNRKHRFPDHHQSGRS